MSPQAQEILALPLIGPGWRLLPMHLGMLHCDGRLPNPGRERQVRIGDRQFFICWTRHNQKTQLAIREKVF